MSGANSGATIIYDIIFIIEDERRDREGRYKRQRLAIPYCVAVLSWGACRRRTGEGVEIGIAKVL